MATKLKLSTEHSGNQISDLCKCRYILQHPPAIPHLGIKPANMDARTNRRGVVFGCLVKYLLHHGPADTVSEGRLYCVTTRLVYGSRNPRLVMKPVLPESCGRNARYRPPKHRTRTVLWRLSTRPNIHVAAAAAASAITSPRTTDDLWTAPRFCRD